MLDAAHVEPSAEMKRSSSGVARRTAMLTRFGFVPLAGPTLMRSGVRLARLGHRDGAVAAQALCFEQTAIRRGHALRRRVDGRCRPGDAAR